MCAYSFVMARVRIEATQQELVEKGEAIVRKIAEAVANAGGPNLLIATDTLSKSGTPAPGHQAGELLLRAFPVKQRVRIRRLSIGIEHPAGSLRPWTDAEGNTGHTRMRAHYGYVEGTTAVDGDEYDVFVNPECKNLDAMPFVYVVHANERSADGTYADAAFGRYDEDKAFLGWPSAQAVKDSYIYHYGGDESFFGSMTRLTWDEFVQVAKNGTGMASITSAQPVSFDDAAVRKAAQPSVAPQASLTSGRYADRAVRTGGAGPGIHLDLPDRYVPPVPDPSAKDRLLTGDDETFELPFAADRAKARRKNLEDAAEGFGDAELGTNSPVRPLEQADLARRRYSAEDLAESAKVELDHLEDRADRHEVSMAPLVLDDTGLASKSIVGDEGPGLRLTGTRPSGFWLEAAPQIRRFKVTAPSGAEIVVKSITAACNETWARERGFESATQARKQLEKSRLPSGASWAFWGLDRPRVK